MKKIKVIVLLVTLVLIVSVNAAWAVEIPKPTSIIDQIPYRSNINDQEISKALEQIISAYPEYKGYIPRTAGRDEQTGDITITFPAMVNNIPVEDYPMDFVIKPNGSISKSPSYPLPSLSKFPKPSKILSLAEAEKIYDQNFSMHLAYYDSSEGVTFRENIPSLLVYKPTFYGAIDATNGKLLDDGPLSREPTREKVSFNENTQKPIVKTEEEAVKVAIEIFDADLKGLKNYANSSGKFIWATSAELAQNHTKYNQGDRLVELDVRQDTGEVINFFENTNSKIPDLTPETIKQIKDKLISVGQWYFAGYTGMEFATSGSEIYCFPLLNGIPVETRSITVGIDPATKKVIYFTKTNLDNISNPLPDNQNIISDEQAKEVYNSYFPFYLTYMIVKHTYTDIELALVYKRGYWMSVPAPVIDAFTGKPLK